MVVSVLTYLYFWSTEEMSQSLFCPWRSPQVAQPSQFGAEPALSWLNGWMRTMQWRGVTNGLLYYAFIKRWIPFMGCVGGER